MSMIGNYRRVTPAELTWLRKAPEHIAAFLYPEERESVPADRKLDIDKTWHTIHFLLTDDPWEGTPPLQNVVLGGTPLGEDTIGYGPARFLLPAQVLDAANALAALPFSILEGRFDLDRLAAADIYPSIWDGADRDEELNYLKPNYEALVAFFAQAARSGDAMLVYIN